MTNRFDISNEFAAEFPLFGQSSWDALWLTNGSGAFHLLLTNDIDGEAARDYFGSHCWCEKIEMPSGYFLREDFGLRLGELAGE
jgi:hypothetical protein